MLYYVTLLFQSFLLYAASGHHLAVSQAVHFLCDAQGLVHEAVGQQVELILGIIGLPQGLPKWQSFLFGTLFVNV